MNLKKRIKYLSYLISLSLLFNASCSKNQNNLEETTITKDNKLEDKEFLDLENRINSVPNNYNFYLEDKILNSISYDAKSIQKCDKTNTDYSNLDKIIINNTINSKDNNIFNKELDNIFRRCLKKAINNCFKISSNKNEDICNLSNLKIINKSLEENVIGQYNYKSNTIYIDYEKILNIYPSYNISLESGLTKTLEHEINHAKASICECRRKKYQFNKNISSMNTLNFLLEASSESAIYNKEKIDLTTTTWDYTYLNERVNESLLFLLVAFQKEVNLEDYYKAIFNSDLPALYNFFALDLKTFYKITYAMDTLLKYNDLSKSYEPKNLKKEVGFAYKIDIFKIALNDLIKVINKETFTIEESLYLYNFLKSYILTDTNLIIDGNLVYEDTFINNILTLENIFYEFIKERYNITDNDIKKIEKNSLYNFQDIYLNENIMNNIDFNKLNNYFPLLKVIAWTSPSVVIYNDQFNDYSLKRKK